MGLMSPSSRPVRRILSPAKENRMEHPSRFDGAAGRKGIEGGKALARLREFEAEGRGLGDSSPSWLTAFTTKEELASAAPAVAVP